MIFLAHKVVKHPEARLGVASIFPMSFNQYFVFQEIKTSSIEPNLVNRSAARRDDSSKELL
jgi:hypothetical protein